MRKALLGVLFSALFFLAGCQSGIEEHRSGTDAAYWQSMQEKLSSVTVLEESGRLGLISPQERGSANYSYALQGENFMLELSTTFGSQIAFLSVTDGAGELTMNGRTINSPDATLLLKEVFGLEIPLEKLRKVFLGVPDGMVVYDETGRIKSAQSDGFSVNYHAFSEFNGFALPVSFDIQSGVNIIKVRCQEVAAVQ